MKAKPRMLAPSECNTEAKARRLRRNISENLDAWMMADGQTVTISNASGHVYIRIADMRKFARWFLRKQRCK